MLVHAALIAALTTTALAGQQQPTAWWGWFGRDANNTFRSGYAAPASCRVQSTWEVYAACDQINILTGVGSKLYSSCSAPGAVVAIDPSKAEPLWTFAPKDTLVLGSTVIPTTDRVIVSLKDYETDQARVLGLDGTTGDVLWNASGIANGIGFFKNPTLSPDGKTLVIATEQAMRAMDSADGAIRWTNQQGVSGFSFVVTADSVIFAADADPNGDTTAVFSVDLRTGARRWRSTPQPVSWGSVTVSSEGTVIAVLSEFSGSQHRRGGKMQRDHSSEQQRTGMYAFDPKNGTTLWHLPFEPARAGILVLSYDGVAYSVASNGRVLGVSTATGSETVRFSLPPRCEQEPPLFVSFTLNAYLLFQCGDQSSSTPAALYAVDRRGTIIWTTAVADSIELGMAIPGPAGTTYLGTRKGVTAISAEGDRPCP